MKILYYSCVTAILLFSNSFYTAQAAPVENKPLVSIINNTGSPCHRLESSEIGKSEEFLFGRHDEIKANILPVNRDVKLSYQCGSSKIDIALRVEVDAQGVKHLVDAKEIDHQKADNLLINPTLNDVDGISKVIIWRPQLLNDRN